MNTSANVIFLSHTLQLVGWGNQKKKGKEKKKDKKLALQAFTDWGYTERNDSFLPYIQCVQWVALHMENVSQFSSVGAKPEFWFVEKWRAQTSSQTSNSISNKQENQPHFLLDDNYLWQQIHCFIAFASYYSCPCK